MSSTPSDRPQNRRPERLIQSRKEVARRNHEAVRVTVQALRRRGVAPGSITVPAVARESGVSASTIYRRDDLFALVRRANPGLQRRPAERVYGEQLAALRQELAGAREDAELRKQVVDLQRRVHRLEERLAACTCGAAGRQKPQAVEE